MNNENHFDTEKIIELSKKITHDDALENISNYNDDMTISQVVRFFEKRGIEFTKTMIQNYVRVNTMPPPVDKRYYTKDHLILLTLIDRLKAIYSLDDIKKLFHPILKDVSTFDDDMIDMAAIYNIYRELYNDNVDSWKKELPVTIDKIKEMVSKGDVADSGKDTMYFFLTILTLMAESIAIKDYVNVLLADFSKMQNMNIKENHVEG